MKTIKLIIATGLTFGLAVATMNAQDNGKQTPKKEESKSKDSKNLTIKEKGSHVVQGNTTSNGNKEAKPTTAEPKKQEQKSPK